MSTFKEAEQVRLALKMKLSNYSWYKNSSVLGEGDGYIVVIVITMINNQIRKIIPPLLNGVSIKTEVN